MINHIFKLSMEFLFRFAIHWRKSNKYFFQNLRASFHVHIYFFIRYCGSRADFSDNVCSLRRENALIFYFCANVLGMAQEGEEKNENFLDTPVVTKPVKIT